jgi:hypothetical protein
MENIDKLVREGGARKLNLSVGAEHDRVHYIDTYRYHILKNDGKRQNERGLIKVFIFNEKLIHFIEACVILQKLLSS